ncbi:MAG: hypothetical protein WC516_04695 [Patescibacteria group bacterium]|jgi:hypothetical protein
MKDEFDELIEKFKSNTEKMKILVKKLEEQNEKIYNLRIEINLINSKIRSRKLGQEEILN